ncbi:MAG TPA: EAL domain-containing protein [Allosphingosinicella sp.]|jgi:diguanylate cyclase (GGDEF)-like protein
MRRGRFADLQGDSPGPAPLGLRALLLFDFRAPASEDDARIAAERARALVLSVPFLAASHALWAVALLATLFFGGHGGLPVAAPFALLLLLDAGFCRLIAREAPPHRKTRWAAGYILLAALLFGAAVPLLPHDAPLLARAMLFAALSAGIAAFFLFPLLLVLSCLVALAGAALISSGSPLVAIVALGSVLFVCLSVSRTRDLVFAAGQRLAAEWEALKARRFVEEYEESGRGWFWETNAEGRVTYLSQGLVERLGVAEPVGARLEDLLLVQSCEEGDEGRRTLGFHLSARFPFSEVIVRAPASDQSWWSLSGTPNFDNFGRFLGFRGIGANLSEQLRSEAEETKLARYDSLTGLPNRAMMRRTLDDALANAAERRRGCALMMIDLDRFKQVNDTLGHPVGDSLLKQVAARLHDVLGDLGQAGRVGGDEFEAILPGVDEEARLEGIAGRLIAQVSRPYEVDGHKVEIGASVGIAIAQPGKAYASGLIRDSDLALYAAKAAGRGTFRFFAPEMHRLAAERQMLENDLRDALAKDQLRLFYQPIVDSVTEEVTAFEALLRWQHPTRGLLQPAAFLPIAEDCGLMPRIGAWVVRSACAEAAGWPDHVRVAVNLSPAQVADPGVPSVVTSALASSGIAPERLELEISEGAFPADGAGPARMLSRLKSLGVRLALDNFGTGRSGLGHLRDAPLDKIKIDRSFVCGAGPKDSRNAAIIRAIVVLAESLGMDTTAEGTETLEELALVRSLGCSQVQGFLFGKAVPADEARTLAAASRPSAEAVRFSRPPRHRLLRNGVLHQGDARVQARVRNISEGGAMVECDAPLAPDSRVLLDLDEAGLLEAEVRWAARGQVGMRFDQPFELRRLAPAKPGSASLKMMTPTYLENMPEADDEPPLRKPARRAR